MYLTYSKDQLRTLIKKLTLLQYFCYNIFEAIKCIFSSCNNTASTSLIRQVPPRKVLPTKYLREGRKLIKGDPCSEAVAILGIYKI